MIEKLPSKMLFICSALLLWHSTSCTPRTIKDHAMVAEEFLIRRFKAQDWMNCIMSCQEEPKCESYNYQYKGNSLCELYRLDEKKDLIHTNLVYMDGFVFQYLKEDKVKLCDIKPSWKGNTKKPGASKDNEYQKNCTALKSKYPNAISGQFSLDIDGDGPLPPFTAYCDMETDGGGWTLVWSYAVHSNDSYMNILNCVHPLPKDMTKTKSSFSDSPPQEAPQNETDFKAIDFPKWRLIGNEFLVKSNINDWVSCVPKTGNLVNGTSGNVSCTSVKNVDQNSCFEIPGKIEMNKDGIIFIGEVNKTLTFFYDQGADSFRNLSIEDPCGLGINEQRINWGSIYLR